MFLRFLYSLAVIKIGFNFNVFASSPLCRATSVKDTCADKVADLQQPQKLFVQLMWGFNAMEFKPHDDKKKVLSDHYTEEVPEEIMKRRPELDGQYVPAPLVLGPLILTCANDRDVFPNACSAYSDIEIFTLKKALRSQTHSEKMLHARALGDIPDIPGLPIGDFAGLEPDDMMKQLREQMVKPFKDQNLPSEILTMGGAWYFFSEYDAETKETKDVMKAIFSLGKDIGACEMEYTVNGTACFGMQGTSRPAVDPPKPPALPDKVLPPIKELKATKPPGSGGGGSTGVIITVVVVILLLIGAGGFFYVRQKKIEAAHGREVQMSWAKESSLRAFTCQQMRSVARSRDFRDLGLEPLEMWKKCGWNWREWQIWECGCIWNNEQDELEYWKLRFRNMKFEVGIFEIWNSCYCSLELLGGLPSLGSLQKTRGYRKKPHKNWETLWERISWNQIGRPIFFGFQTLKNFTSET